MVLIIQLMTQAGRPQIRWHTKALQTSHNGLSQRVEAELAFPGFPTNFSTRRENAVLTQLPEPQTHLPSPGGVNEPLPRIGTGPHG